MIWLHKNKWRLKGTILITMSHLLTSQTIMCWVFNPDESLDWTSELCAWTLCASGCSLTDHLLAGFFELYCLVSVLRLLFWSTVFLSPDTCCLFYWRVCSSILLDVTKWWFPGLPFSAAWWTGPSFKMEQSWLTLKNFGKPNSCKQHTQQNLNLFLAFMFLFFL